MFIFKCHRYYVTWLSFEPIKISGLTCTVVDIPFYFYFFLLLLLLTQYYLPWVLSSIFLLPWFNFLLRLATSHSHSLGLVYPDFFACVKEGHFQHSFAPFFQIVAVGIIIIIVIISSSNCSSSSSSNFSLMIIGISFLCLRLFLLYL